MVARSGSKPTANDEPKAKLAPPDTVLTTNCQKKRLVNESFQEAAGRIREGLLRALWNGPEGRFNARYTATDADLLSILTTQALGAMFLQSLQQPEWARQWLTFAEAQHRLQADGIEGYRLYVPAGTDKAPKEPPAVSADGSLSLAVLRGV